VQLRVPEELVFHPVRDGDQFSDKYHLESYASLQLRDAAQDKQDQDAWLQGLKGDVEAIGSLYEHGLNTSDGVDAIVYFLHAHGENFNDAVKAVGRAYGVENLTSPPTHLAPLEASPVISPEEEGLRRVAQQDASVFERYLREKFPQAQWQSGDAAELQAAAKEHRISHGDLVQIAFARIRDTTQEIQQLILAQE